MRRPLQTSSIQLHRGSGWRSRSQEGQQAQSWGWGGRVPCGDRDKGGAAQEHSRGWEEGRVEAAEADRLRSGARGLSSEQ